MNDKNNVIDLPDTQEAQMRRVMNNLSESAIDLAMYCSYVYNRGNCGISIEGMRKMGFASDGMLADMELQYQEELLMKGKE